MLICIAVNAQEIPFDKKVASFEHIPVVEQDRVTILLTDMKRIRGNFVNYESNKVNIRDDAGEFIFVPAEDIAYLRLEYDRGGRALRSGMWGGIIGLFVGIPVGSYFVSQKEADESANDAFIYIGSSLGSGILGGLIGTGIGLATVPGDVVYKIER
jgi:hypothetical protein